MVGKIFNLDKGDERYGRENDRALPQRCNSHSFPSVSRAGSVVGPCGWPRSVEALAASTCAISSLHSLLHSSHSFLDRLGYPTFLHNARPAKACVGYYRVPVASRFEAPIGAAQAAMHIVILRSQQYSHQQVWQRPQVLAP